MILIFEIQLPDCVEKLALDYHGWDCMKAIMEDAETYIREKYPDAIKHELTDRMLPVVDMGAE